MEARASDASPLSPGERLRLNYQLERRQRLLAHMVLDPLGVALPGELVMLAQEHADPADIRVSERGI